MAKRKEKSEHKRHARRRASGGRASEHEYNAEGAPVMKVAKDTKAEGFNRGGKIEGKEPKKRLDKKPRGESRKEARRDERGGEKRHEEIKSGRPHMAAGGSPYSAAHKGMKRSENRNSGHEGEDPGRVP